MQEALRIDAIWCAHMIVLVPDQQIRTQEALRIDAIWCPYVTVLVTDQQIHTRKSY